jgi:Mannosyltransferase (PIG-V)
VRPGGTRASPDAGAAVPSPDGNAEGPEDAPGRSTRRAAERARIRDGVVYCLRVFVGLRMALLLLALTAVALVPAREAVSVPGWPAPELSPGPHNVFTAWERFDALWFLRIAEDGYEDGDGSAAFYPLYPALIRAMSPVLGGAPLAAALLVSNLAFLGALIALYFLTASERSETTARRAVLYTAVFPTSFFFLAPYSESVFLLVVVAAFWAARRGRWPLAAVFGAMAGLTRSVGMVVAPALAVEALHQWRERRRAAEATSFPAVPLLWSAGAAVGGLAYLAYWRVAAGDWLAPIHQQTQWQREGELPWVTLWRGTREAFRWLGVYPGGYHLLDWLIVIPALGLVAYAAARYRPAYGVYAVASVLAPLSLIFADRPLMSVPRYLAVVFPITWALGDLTNRGRLSHVGVVGVSAGLLGTLTVLFVNWYFMF